jgi:hypothetical protein
MLKLNLNSEPELRAWMVGQLNPVEMNNVALREAIEVHGMVREGELNVVSIQC